MRSVDLHLVPASIGDPPAEPRASAVVTGPAHSVQFYENDAFLAASVADFLADGLAQGDPVLVLATSAHRRAFSRRLRARGLDVEAARRDGLLTWCDADAMLARIMVGAVPDEARFRAEVEPLLERAALRQRGPVVRAYGELVDVLWQRGDTTAALRLEELWNDLARTHRFALLCGYAMGPFVGTAGNAGRAAVCAQHDHVHEPTLGPVAVRGEPAVPARDAARAVLEALDALEVSGLPAEPDGADPVRERDILRRHARALATEVEHRRFLEQRLRAALADRRASERELRRSRRLLVEAQRLAHVGSWSFVPETGAAEWSEELWRVLGLDPSAGAPSLDRLLASVHPADAADLRILLQRVAAAADAGAPEPEARELRVRRPDGALRTCEVRVTATSRVAGHPPVLHGTVLDVTEQRRAEAERRALDARLLETQRLETIGVLAGGIAHDFNNLLTTMLGNADLLQSGMRPDSADYALADEILLAGRRSADLTRQLLAYAGHASYQVRELELGALAREVGALLRTAMPAGGALRLEAPEGGAMVAGDRAQLTQVLMNLVANAAEALPAGGGEVAVRVRAVYVDPDEAAQLAADGRTTGAPMPAGPCVRVEVADSGAGMSDAVRARMFEPFFSTKFTGRGLGLAATLGIVRAHRGALTVRSAPGAGTTVTLWLPALGVDAPRATPPRGIPLTAGVDRPRLLVVDDDPAVRGTLARMLGRLGYDVVEAADGAAALAAVGEEASGLELAIVDVTMPDARGEDLATRLVARRPGLAVLFTSGYCDGEPGRRAAGAPPGPGLLPKPYDMVTLARIVGAALGAAHPPR